MRAKKDRSSSPSARPKLPIHVFTEEYIALMAERDEPETAPEADTAGPWHVEPHPLGWAVFREGESLAKGHTPAAVFLRREVALIIAAALPGTGSRLRYHLSTDPDAEGHTPVLLEGRQALVAGPGQPSAEPDVSDGGSPATPRGSAHRALELCMAFSAAGQAPRGAVLAVQRSCARRAAFCAGHER